jgi:truncated hemoglobin YjbI
MSALPSGRSLYDAFGGRPACRRLAVAFYARVDRDPILRPLFPGKSMTCAIEEFAAFLAQFLGGPSEDSQRRWWLSLRESHMRFKISQGEREAWIANMIRAFNDAGIEEPFRSELLGLFQGASAHVVNQGPNSIDRDEGGIDRRVEDNELSGEFRRRWKAHKMLDEAVAAIRGGDAHRAIALAESPDIRVCGRTVLCGLISLMIRYGQATMMEYVAETVNRDPALRRERYAGRTLLHEAAAAGRLETVQLLLGPGADPNSKDGGAHTPLYSLANECSAKGGGQVARVLVQAGGDVDAHDGVKHCTPLHMAARRGHLEVAEALLDCGANIEARDSLGETPLRRAVNCNKFELASLLLSRGADPHSKGSKGSTPILAARTAAMKEILLRAVGKRTGQ